MLWVCRPYDQVQPYAHIVVSNMLLTNTSLNKYQLFLINHKLYGSCFIIVCIQFTKGECVIGMDGRNKTVFEFNYGYLMTYNDTHAWQLITC